ncbi:YciI family protein [Pectobacterium punjabense]|uniref:YciI family protein n=1 Tax=Pectobacterium punjabense TaxID=2108399 RepID=UPI002405D1D9|nr:YciI family protein [Pectobacterium punjabense]MDG0798420.1 YciI family protein [Pectobacterium punjabense]
MFLINISLKDSDTDEETAAKRFEQHRNWFAKHFKEGNFLILGPYQDKEHAGVIIAQAENREALEKILAEDVYSPLDLANYDVHEFDAILVADNIKQFEGR